LAAQLGNLAFGALIGRSGTAILSDGTIHPDVEATIVCARGGGAARDGQVRQRLASAGSARQFGEGIALSAQVGTRRRLAQLVTIAGVLQDVANPTSDR
jgi:hypothetical protein